MGRDRRRGRLPARRGGARRQGHQGTGSARRRRDRQAQGHGVRQGRRDETRRRRRLRLGDESVPDAALQPRPDAQHDELARRPRGADLDPAARHQGIARAAHARREPAHLLPLGADHAGNAAPPRPHRVVAPEHEVRPRNTLLLLLVLAALGAYVYWVELPHEKREAEQKQLLTFEKDKVASITLEYPDHQIALARDADKHWRLVKPIEAPADDTAANNLVTAVADAKVTRTLDDVADKLASYGLAPPEAVVKLGLEGGTELPALKVGKTTQVGFSAYVQKDDEKSVRIAGGALQTGLKKDVKDLRDKNVIAFDEAQVKRV
ncbi:MAG: DUF4340 domain-containing protein, partial [Deltaproteobacteria bacterium]